MPTIKIHNVTTDEIIEREMNAQELAQWEADKAEFALESETKAKATADKLTLLAKLGITEEEAKLLLS